jgi:hypothetical protein
MSRAGPLHVLRPTNAAALVRASADAALLVVPAWLPELTAVLAASHCPVAAVPRWSPAQPAVAWCCARGTARTSAAARRSTRTCRLAYPDVDVRTVLADDEPVAFLGALAARAQLLIGGSARFERFAGFAPSASRTLATSAGCPVLVVPPGWPPRRDWPRLVGQPRYAAAPASMLTPAR